MLRIPQMLRTLQIGLTVQTPQTSLTHHLNRSADSPHAPHSPPPLHVNWIATDSYNSSASCRDNNRSVSL